MKAHESALPLYRKLLLSAAEFIVSLNKASDSIMQITRKVTNSANGEAEISIANGEKERESLSYETKIN